MKYEQIKIIRTIYEQGGNIIKWLKDKDGRTENTIEDILISYDFQAGTYRENYYKNEDRWENLYKERGNILKEYIGKYMIKSQISILEAGIGEASALYGFLHDVPQPLDIYGFDLSWSRVKYAELFLKEKEFHHKTTLFTGDLLNILLADSTMDIVYTNHAVEPNGGSEEKILRELYRVAKSCLVLFEPDNKIATMEGKARMKENGYIKDLYELSKELWGNQVVAYDKLEYHYNELNPASAIVIIKNKNQEKERVNKENCFIDPVTHDTLEKYKEDSLYSNTSLCMYPIIQGIPCLLEDNAILATKYMDFME